MTKNLGLLSVLAFFGLLPFSSSIAEDHSALAKTPHFAFYSDFTPNLHDTLITDGTAQVDQHALLFEEGEAQTCFQDLPPSKQLGWTLAVDFYAQVMSGTQWSGRQQMLLPGHLAELPMDLDQSAQEFIDVVGGFLAAAAPAYRVCYWETQQQVNQVWLDRLMPKLQQHEQAIGQQLETYYGRPWHGLPLRIDIVPQAGPKNANAINIEPEGGHVFISPRVADADALDNAAAQLGVAVPDGLWHVLLFYTTGKAVQVVLGESGEPEYDLYMDRHRLWDSSWARFRAAVESSWPTYLEGQASLSEGSTSLLHKLSLPSVKSPDSGRASRKPEQPRSD